MVFGLGSKHTAPKTKDASKSASKKTGGSRSDEAAEILKKMEAKKDAGTCAFC
jgi:hypothetical protein